MKQMICFLALVTCLLLASGGALGAGKVAEVDQFHAALHPLVHDAFPNKDFAAIRAQLPDLVTAATAMSKAVLPPELAGKQKEYRKEAKSLVKQLKEMNKKKGKLSDDELGAKFMKMHDTFEKIMGIVE